MLLTVYDPADGFAQLITVLLIFVFVLGLTWYVTRWIARYQRGQKHGSNVNIVESYPAGNGKYIQIVKIGETYFAIAACKDTVTLLGEIPGDQLHYAGEEKAEGVSFKDLFRKAGSAYRNGGQDDNASKEE